MSLGNLKKPAGATHRSKRLGRGRASGKGKTSGRGTKGAKARTGFRQRPEFEGGQMPFVRRIPKRGFTHEKRRPFAVVNLEALNRFPADAVVNAKALAEAGLIRSEGLRVKVLGDGELKQKLTVQAAAFSGSALKKIAAAGGKTETA
ncbi:MAG: 50S ribosomal protein L15 [Candidatus Omnitrophica bacterium CG11_big_fil_rev_8_21_14_0_20_64_10]|nr:MAG: 50S ribosomal protein L15 [Candidatus Omnitrophica bacterium CG11_big_fil_rev_8_21_14_0_20_64_10]